jgi:hypothetical protein
MDENIVEQHLGSDIDRDLFARLVHAIELCGGIILQVYSGVAGTHTIVVHEINIGDDMLTMRSETGAGMVLRGPRDAVEKLTQLVNGHTTLW